MKSETQPAARKAAHRIVRQTAQGRIQCWQSELGFLEAHHRELRQLADAVEQRILMLRQQIQIEIASVPNTATKPIGEK